MCPCNNFDNCSGNAGCIDCPMNRMTGDEKEPNKLLWPIIIVSALVICYLLFLKK